MRKKKPAVEGNQAASNPPARPQMDRSPSLTKGETFIATGGDSRLAIATNVVLGGTLLLAGICAYWSTCVGLFNTWRNVPDYSHGFLVIPLAIIIGFARRDSIPTSLSPSWTGAIVSLIVCATLRLLSVRYFFLFLEHWSILAWALACAFAMGGWRLARWSLPMIAFLGFMFPLPFRLEGQLSGPLQAIATKISVWCLQLLGQPCHATGNVIHIGANTLEVAQACSGLRLFLSIVAVGYAWLALTRGPLWEKAALALATIPIAIAANAARIVGTGLLFQATTDEWLRHMAHDAGGWLMMPVAAVLFWLWYSYLQILFPEDDEVNLSTLVRRVAL